MPGLGKEQPWARSGVQGRWDYEVSASSWLVVSLTEG